MKDLFSIEGKIALVTGGSRGIGEMIAAGFLSSGVKVYISSRKVEACDSAAQKHCHKNLAVNVFLFRLICQIFKELRILLRRSQVKNPNWTF